MVIKALKATKVATGKLALKVSVAYKANLVKMAKTVNPLSNFGKLRVITDQSKTSSMLTLKIRCMKLKFKNFKLVSKN